MNLEPNQVRYELLERLNNSTPAALETQTDETVANVLSQASEGYVLTGVVDSEDAIAFEYTFFPEAEAAATNSQDSFDLEQFSADDFDDFEAEILKQEDLNNNIARLSVSREQNGGQIFNAYFEPSTGSSFYTSDEDSIRFKRSIDSSLRAGRTLTDIDYGDGTWIATFDESDKNTAISSNRRLSELNGQIETRIDRGENLVDLEYGDGLWIARFEDKPGDSSYARNADYELFQEEVAAQRADGFELVDVEYVSNSWFGVFNESEATTATATPNLPLLTDINDSDTAATGALPELPELI